MKKISIMISWLLILCFLSVYTVYASEENLYEDLFVERLDIECITGDEIIYWYEELYYYYADSNSDTPAYALVKASQPAVDDGFISSYFGEYVIITGCFSPYKHGYYIYTPADDKIYTLEEAYHAEIEGIEKALEFLNGKSIALIGDADANFQLNIKDATWIQKCLANYYYPTEGHVRSELAYEACDFNRDSKLNIKDVTAIQKKLAGLEY